MLVRVSKYSVRRVGLEATHKLKSYLSEYLSGIEIALHPSGGIAECPYHSHVRISGERKVGTSYYYLEACCSLYLQPRA